MPEVGDLVDGRYRLVRQIAEGGMGVVFEATHERLGKAVAVKFLLERFAEVESSAHERFEQEARAAVAIGHRSIVDVNDYGTTDEGHPYIVMELLRGRSLASLLKEQGRLEVPLAAHIICQVLSALVYAHRMGVIHRDLKPDNVFLVEDDRALPEVKILDFGISKVSKLEGMDTAKTKSGVVLGTPDYMSPEQARGEKDLDHRIDIYAVGALLYECLSGRPPLEADNYNALLLKIALEEPLPIAEIVEGLPEGVARVVGKATAREREERFGQALEMLHALAPFAEQSLLPPEVRLAPEDAASGEGLAFKPTAAATPRAKRGKGQRGPTGRRGAALRTAAIVALALVAVTAAAAAILHDRQGVEEARRGTPARPERPGRGVLPTRPDASLPEVSPAGDATPEAPDRAAGRDSGPAERGADYDPDVEPRPGRSAWKAGLHPSKRPRVDAGREGAPLDAAAPHGPDHGPDSAVERTRGDVVFQPEFR